jgi:hypothetical protein
MDSIPPLALPLLAELAPAFTQPTLRRALTLLVAAVLTTGRRTVANLLRTAGSLADGHPSSYQRLLSCARWQGLRLAAALGRFLLRNYWPVGRVRLVGDDTVTEHRGRSVYGKARHRDAVRSSHSYTAHRYGHRWVVLAVLVQFPFAVRPWALPVLVALYHSPEGDRERGRPHKTPAELMVRLLRVLLRWFPGRQFVFAGDQGYGTHPVARFAAGTGGRLALVSRFYADASLYEPPPAVTGRKPTGRPRKKGAKVPAPETVAAGAKKSRLEVAWYGGGRRSVEVATGVGHWYKSGAALVPVRWVFVRDRTGTHRDDYLFTTDTGLTPRQIIEEYTGRWSIETTFQDCRAYLGLGTTRGWRRSTVLRAEPCLLGLYSVVAVLYSRLPPAVREDWQVVWLGKESMAFSDAITAVRRWLWEGWVFERAGHSRVFQKLPGALRETLLYALAPAA